MPSTGDRVGALPAPSAAATEASDMFPRFEFCLRLAPQFALVVGLVLHASGAAAEPAPDDTIDTTRAAARELAQQGIDAYQSEDYANANLKLEKAYRLFSTPTLGLWSARSRMRLGQWVKAAERYREATRASAAVGDSAMQQQAQKEAAEELASLTPRIPALTIELEGGDGAGISLTLDGAALSSELFGVRIPVNPGQHRIVATRGGQRAEAEVRVAEREHKRVPLRFAAMAAAAVTEAAKPAPKTSAPVTQQVTAPPMATAVAAPAVTHTSPAEAAARAELAPTPGTEMPLAATAATGAQPRDQAGVPLRPIAIAALALGGVGLVASGVTALMALGKCSRGDCASNRDKEKYDSLATASTVTGWAGAALAAGGLVTWLVAPERARDQAALNWNVGPLGVSVRGAL